MPHRILNSQLVQHACEFAVLTFTAFVASINTLIDETSWDRLTGRHGALFVMAIGLLIFWNSSRVRAKRDIERQAKLEAKEDARRLAEEKARQEENKAREERHREQMRLQADNAERLTNLTVEQIKAQGMVSESLKALTRELKKRPCQIEREES